jgi:hypothetical protein
MTLLGGLSLETIARWNILKQRAEEILDERNPRRGTIFTNITLD